MSLVPHTDGILLIVYITYGILLIVAY